MVFAPEEKSLSVTQSELKYCIIKQILCLKYYLESVAPVHTASTSTFNYSSWRHNKNHSQRMIRPNAVSLKGQDKT